LSILNLGTVAGESCSPRGWDGKALTEGRTHGWWQVSDGKPPLLPDGFWLLEGPASAFHDFQVIFSGGDAFAIQLGGAFPLGSTIPQGNLSTDPGLGASQSGRRLDVE